MLRGCQFACMSSDGQINGGHQRLPLMPQSNGAVRWCAIPHSSPPRFEPPLRHKKQQQRNHQQHQRTIKQQQQQYLYVCTTYLEFDPRGTQSTCCRLHLLALIYKRLESPKRVSYESLHLFLLHTHASGNDRHARVLPTSPTIVYTLSRTRSAKNSRLLSRAFSVEAINLLPDRYQRKNTKMRA